MQGIEELDHYELLEVRRGATATEIDRAYRLAQETWADGSLALYSVFDKRDASAVRARLDEAYRVLADPELRASYDRANGAAVSGDASVGEAVQEVESELRAEPPRRSDASDDAPSRYDDAEDEGAGDFDGPRLRRTRLFRGYEIDQIADVTKVSGTHLRNIEDENFGELPAEVYVRGFVTAYAKTVGLDPQIVVPSYMARFRDSKQKNQRSRFLGLR